ncbi:MAG: hypothetical protein KAJ19_25030, partial [Gammaproteobacteria bacterium]|nr:hypothetical protein [Gammaproteobacteria bacterium]
KAIFSLQRQVTKCAKSIAINTVHIAEQAERIVELERQVSLQHERIARLETVSSQDKQNASRNWRRDYLK